MSDDAVDNQFCHILGYLFVTYFTGADYTIALDGNFRVVLPSLLGLSSQTTLV